MGSNLFGDLLSEITAAISGAIGIAPSANLNPEGTFPSLFEPIHGSAPDIAGQGKANPAGAIWAGALMLEHVGYAETGSRILAALEETLEAGTKTGDLGGTADTGEMTDAVIDAAGVGAVRERVRYERREPPTATGCAARARWRARPSPGSSTDRTTLRARGRR